MEFKKKVPRRINLCSWDYSSYMLALRPIKYNQMYLVASVFKKKKKKKTDWKIQLHDFRVFN